MKAAFKPIIYLIALSLVLPAAALTGFGRWQSAFTCFAQFFSLVPGIPGDYLRIAFYRLTLSECALSSRISFGTFFAHPQAKLMANVYIGSYCVIGMAHIGARSQIASGAQILSGRRQHSRDEAGRITGAEEGVFNTVTIGPDCWIGAAAVIMADVGGGATIGAGSVVTRPIPPDATAVGSPARVIARAEPRAGSLDGYNQGGQVRAL